MHRKKVVVGGEGEERDPFCVQFCMYKRTVCSIFGMSHNFQGGLKQQMCFIHTYILSPACNTEGGNGHFIDTPPTLLGLIKNMLHSRNLYVGT